MGGGTFLPRTKVNTERRTRSADDTSKLDVERWTFDVCPVLNAELTRPAPRPRRFSWALAFVLIFLIAAGLIALIFWRVETWPARTAQQTSAELERLGRKARDAFLSIAQMQPRVTINDRVYLEQTTGIAELALISRRVEVEHEFEHTWAGSTKRVKLHGTFAVKAGFDLREPVSVDVRNNELLVQMPPATVLGIEQEDVEVQSMQNGLWNRVSAADVETELKQLPRLAREKAAASGLTSEAEASLQRQLQERLGRARPVRIQYAVKSVAPVALGTPAP